MGFFSTKPFKVWQFLLQKFEFCLAYSDEWIQANELNWKCQSNRQTMESLQEELCNKIIDMSELDTFYNYLFIQLTLWLQLGNGNDVFKASTLWLKKSCAWVSTMENIAGNVLLRWIEPCSRFWMLLKLNRLMHRATGVRVSLVMKSGFQGFLCFFFTQIFRWNKIKLGQI